MPFYWTFLPFLGYTARMPLFSRISPGDMKWDHVRSVFLNSCRINKDGKMASIDMILLDLQCVIHEKVNMRRINPLFPFLSLKIVFSNMYLGSSKILWWNLLRKNWTVQSCNLFSHKISSKILANYHNTSECLMAR